MSKDDHPWIGADAIIMDDKNNVLLIKRSPDAESFPGMWGVISGFVEWGETIKEALKREAKEEIGVDIEVLRFTGRYYDKKNRHPTKTVICLPHICKIISGKPRALSECTRVEWFSPEEIRKIEMAYDHKQMLVDEGLI
jgi:8-oxo-dGTP diphosphatase